MSDIVFVKLWLTVFRDRFFLRYSSWLPLATAAIFLLFLNDAILMKIKVKQCLGLNYFSTFNSDLKKTKLGNTVIKNAISSISTVKYTNISTFVFPIGIFFLGGKHNCLHANSEYKLRERTLLLLFTKLKFRHWRKMNTFLFFSFHIGHVFCISRQKMNELNPSDVDIKMRIPALT